MEREVKPYTVWRHFKGMTAFVIAVANHSETGEELVVYRCTGNAGRTTHKTTLFPLNVKTIISCFCKLYQGRAATFAK